MTNDPRLATPRRVEVIVRRAGRAKFTMSDVTVRAWRVDIAGAARYFETRRAAEVAAECETRMREAVPADATPAIASYLEARALGFSWDAYNEAIDREIYGVKEES